MLQIAIAVNSRTIWSINAQNDGTGTEEIGNYGVEVYKVDRGVLSGRPRAELVAELRLEGFGREQGALGLARQVLNRIRLEVGITP